MKILAQLITTLMQTHNFDESRRRFIKVTGGVSALFLTTTEASLSLLGQHGNLLVEESDSVPAYEDAMSSSICWQPPVTSLEELLEQKYTDVGTAVYVMSVSTPYILTSSGWVCLILPESNYYPFPLA